MKFFVSFDKNHFIDLKQLSGLLPTNDQKKKKIIFWCIFTNLMADNVCSETTFNKIYAQWRANHL